MAKTNTLKNVTDNLSDKIESVVPNSNEAPHEGRLTRAIEMQTSKLPSVSYLGLAIGSMAVSAGLAVFAERKAFANFVGLWAPSFLLLGIYNKLVKLEGSDQFSGKQNQSQNFGATANSI